MTAPSLGGGGVDLSLGLEKRRVPAKGQSSCGAPPGSLQLTGHSFRKTAEQGMNCPLFFPWGLHISSGGNSCFPWQWRNQFTCNDFLFTSMHHIFSPLKLKRGREEMQQKLLAHHWEMYCRQFRICKIREYQYQRCGFKWLMCSCPEDTTIQELGQRPCSDIKNC